MNFIKVDLNQTVSKAQLEQIKEEQKRWALCGFIIVLFIGSLGWFYFINNKLNFIVEERNNTIQTIKMKTEELTNKGKIKLSKIDINNLHKLESKRIYWSDKLLELSKITPEDMAITKFEFKGKMLNISAIANLTSEEKEFSVVENFMKMIDENSKFNQDFKDIKFGFLDKDFAKNQELLSFKIQAKLK